jgi:hypothetical protein
MVKSKATGNSLVSKTSETKDSPNKKLISSSQSSVDSLKDKPFQINCLNCGSKSQKSVYKVESSPKLNKIDSKENSSVKYSTHFAIKFHPFSLKFPSTSQANTLPASSINQNEMNQRCCLSVSVVPSDGKKNKKKSAADDIDDSYTKENDKHKLIDSKKSGKEKQNVKDKDNNNSNKQKIEKNTILPSTSGQSYKKLESETKILNESSEKKKQTSNENEKREQDLSETSKTHAESVLKLDDKREAAPAQQSINSTVCTINETDKKQSTNLSGPIDLSASAVNTIDHRLSLSSVSTSSMQKTNSLGKSNNINEILSKLDKEYSNKVMTINESNDAAKNLLLNTDDKISISSNNTSNSRYKQFERRPKRPSNASITVNTNIPNESIPKNYDQLVNDFSLRINRLRFIDDSASSTALTSPAESLNHFYCPFVANTNRLNHANNNDVDCVNITSINNKHRSSTASSSSSATTTATTSTTSNSSSTSSSRTVSLPPSSNCSVSNSASSTPANEHRNIKLLANQKNVDSNSSSSDTLCSDESSSKLLLNCQINKNVKQNIANSSKMVALSPQFDETKTENVPLLKQAKSLQDPEDDEEIKSIIMNNLSEKIKLKNRIRYEQTSTTESSGSEYDSNTCSISESASFDNFNRKGNVHKLTKKHCKFCRTNKVNRIKLTKTQTLITSMNYYGYSPIINRCYKNNGDERVYAYDNFDCINECLEENEHSAEFLKTQEENASDRQQKDENALNEEDYEDDKCFTSILVEDGFIRMSSPVETNSNKESNLNRDESNYIPNSMSHQLNEDVSTHFPNVGSSPISDLLDSDTSSENNILDEDFEEANNNNESLNDEDDSNQTFENKLEEEDLNGIIKNNGEYSLSDENDDDEIIDLEEQNDDLLKNDDTENDEEDLLKNDDLVTLNSTNCTTVSEEIPSTNRIREESPQSSINSNETLNSSSLNSNNSVKAKQLQHQQLENYLLKKLNSSSNATATSPTTHHTFQQQIIFNEIKPQSIMKNANHLQKQPNTGVQIVDQPMNSSFSPFLVTSGPLEGNASILSSSSSSSIQHNNQIQSHQQQNQLQKPKVRFNLDVNYEKEREWSRVNKILGDASKSQIEWTQEVEV